MRKYLQMVGDLGWIQQHILARLILREDRLDISEAEGIKLSKLANKMTDIVCRELTFVDLVKKLLTFATRFEKGYDEKFVATGIVDIVKDMICSDFLVRENAQSYYL